MSTALSAAPSARPNTQEVLDTYFCSSVVEVPGQKRVKVMNLTSSSLKIKHILQDRLKTGSYLGFPNQKSKLMDKGADHFECYQEGATEGRMPGI